MSFPRRGELCGGITRRQSLIRAGTLGAGCLTLSDLLRLKAQGAVKAQASDKSVIMIWLCGGLSHQDSYDLKPQAPVEVRGEFEPIQTNVPGMEICELMPRQAQMADKFSILRGFRPQDYGNTHWAGHLFTGYCDYENERKVGPARPALGTVVSRLQGSRNAMPPYVDYQTYFFGVDATNPAYLGLAHRPFQPTAEGLKNLSLTLPTTGTLDDRIRLLRSLDVFRADADTRGQMAGIDGFTGRALEILSSNRAREAFDLSRVPDKVVARYGPATQFLTALRLVEAGVRVVTLEASNTTGFSVHRKYEDHWDTHTDNFVRLRVLLPRLDQALHALVTDLHDRGLDQEVLVVVWSEMGRTPRINAMAGRDHWGTAGSVFLAGGGLRMGQVVGETDAHAATVKSRVYSPQNVFATIYRVLGIDPSTTLPDFQGRPRYLLDDGEPIRELL